MIWNKKLVPFRKETLAPQAAAWNPAEALARVRAWASEDPARYRQAFAWADPDRGLGDGAGMLLHHDVRDGKLCTVLAGVRAAMAHLHQTARNCPDIPARDLGAVYDHLAQEYQAFGLTAPARAEVIGEASGWRAEDQAGPARAQGIIEATAEHMGLINQMTRKPLRADQVYIFPCVISNDSPDSYDTIMDPDTTLRNFMEDARAGNSLLAGHQGRLAIGRSFDASMVQAGDLTEVHVMDYMLRGHEVDGHRTDEVARGIDAGLNNDMSQRFGGPAWYRCSICGSDLFRSDCGHIPGLEYDGVKARAVIVDGRLMEHSLVWKGATPGAGIRAPYIHKARSLAIAGRISPDDVDRLQETWGVRIIGADSTISIPDGPLAGPPETRKEANTAMNARQILDAILAGFDPARHASLHSRLVAMRSALTDEATGESVMPQIVRAIVELVDAGQTAVENTVKALREANLPLDISQVVPLAVAGQKARSQAVTDALAEGVRAQGDAFRKDHWERTFAVWEPEDIRAQGAEWKAEADKKLGSGRQTQAPAPDAALPAGADFAALPADKRDAAITEFLRNTGGTYGKPSGQA